jgi:pyruvate dehydrogenase E2 component (dihydrolipoamide acetyltransferase)
VGTMIDVGSVLMWVGATADEVVPAAVPARAAAGAAGGTPTAKALALLGDYGLDAQQVAASGDRLSADDVRRHVAANGLRPVVTAPAKAARDAPAPEVPGTRRALAAHERGMLHTVSWQREHAVPAYLELPYDHEAWDHHARAYGQAQGLLLNPLLPLLCRRLVEIVQAQPRYNATQVGEQRHVYDTVNLGFAAQAGEILYLAVLRDAAALEPAAFVQRLVDLQRRAAAHQLEPQELSGATIAFSSMSRWGVARHVPVLAPHTALIVAHAVDARGQGTLGATYDHRLLHGGDVATLLRRLAAPPKDSAQNRPSQGADA